MRKRSIALALVLLLTVGALILTAGAAEGYDQAVASLAALADTQDPETGAASASFSYGDAVYRVLQEPEGLRLGLQRGTWSLWLRLPERFPGAYEGWLEQDTLLARFSLEPHAYTGQTPPEITELSADESLRPTVTEQLAADLPDLVELTGLVCGDRSVLEALEFTDFRYHAWHSYDKGAVTQAPGCEEAGVKTFVCTVCGETREEAVPALGHAWTLAETLSELETTEDRHGTARFRCSRCGANKTGSRCAAQIFTDMPGKSNWAHDPIDWAYFNGVTAGKTASEFAPKATVTRAEVVSFLWSCAGKPEPKSSRSPFRDVKESSYYFKPVLWAVENGITAGKTPTSFRPKDTCTRAEVVSFLWTGSGRPKHSVAVNPFRDVKKSAYYYDPVLWALENGVTAGKTPTSFKPKDTCTRAEMVAFLYKCSRLSSDWAIWSQSFPLYLGETALNGRVFCRGNRAYLSLAMMEAQFGAYGSGQTHWPVVKKYGVSYITLADAAARWGLAVRFRMEDSSVHLYREGSPSWTPIAGEGQTKGYIRLEDIMPDYGLNKRFTHESLLRLRFIGDYLDANSDAFYVAWIPLYVNPPKKVENNIATRFNFYNTDFVLALDSLILDGGRLGLHGYTHQDHDSVSSVGYEFGPNNELSEAEMLDRFQKAEEIAAALGYTWHFFEFPHYSTTAFQRDVAERHFSVIYQQYPGADPTGRIETHKLGDHVCRWVPTPADYINGRSDLENFCKKLSKCRYRKDVISFFFHPYLDTAPMEVSYEGDQIRYTYDQEASILPTILRLLSSWGCRLGAF